LIRILLLAGLAGLFAYAGTAKLKDLPAFYRDILNYHILGPRLAWPLALYLPWLEVATAAGLLVPCLRRGSLFLLALLMGVFLLALASAWARGLDITCGCFGASSAPAHYPTLLLRDLGLLAVLGLLLGWEGKAENPGGPVAVQAG
jgi:uncharacterized membrane protein YphA (DoxX/SURF4 family)